MGLIAIFTRLDHDFAQSFNQFCFDCTAVMIKAITALICIDSMMDMSYNELNILDMA